MARDDNALGAFLRSRREGMDPQVHGVRTTSRRRTPGLRREEVAARADVSVEWYTRLEQGRGGSPSTQVLDAVARALALDAVEREHLFLLAHGRPPRVRPDGVAVVTPRLQGVLDGLRTSPAYVKNAAWDILAWNEAAAAVLTDYRRLEPRQRNVLRLLFLDPSSAEVLPQWEHEARLALATFRLELSRSGTTEAAAALIEHLGRTSETFAHLWGDQEVGVLGHGTKQLRHTVAGPLALQYSSFQVDDQPGLGLVVYTAVTRADTQRIEALVRDAT